jgi:oligopeptide transport system ATP-binding protein
MADRLIVMYAGHVFETAPTTELFARPANPYTRGLLLSVPDVSDMTRGELYQIPGLPPDVSKLPPGCPFAPRCERAEAVCRQEFPPLVEVASEHHSLCHFAADVYHQPMHRAVTTAADA